MKTNRVVGILMIATISILGIFVLSCSNPLTDIIMNNSRELVYSNHIEPETIGGSDSPLTVPLYAGKSIDVGTVEVWIEGDLLSVRFNTTWTLTETHLDVVLNPEEFPQTKKGNPIPGHFEFKTHHDPGISTYTYLIPMVNFEEAEILYFAAHAEVEEWYDSKLLNRESAWASGYDFPGQNWATYFGGTLASEPGILSFYGIWESINSIPDLFGPGTALEAGSRIVIAEGIYATYYTANDGQQLWDCMHSGTFTPDDPDLSTSLSSTILQSDGGGSYFAPQVGTPLTFNYYNLTETTVTIGTDMDGDGTDDIVLDAIRINPADSSIFGVWDLNGIYTYYDVFPTSFLEMTLDQEMTFTDIGMFTVTGKAFPGGFEPGNEIEGKGFYTYDEFAGTLEIEYLIFEMDGQGGFFPEMGVIDCTIVGDSMSLTFTADADYEPFDPFYLTRQ